MDTLLLLLPWLLTLLASAFVFYVGIRVCSRQPVPIALLAAFSLLLIAAGAASRIVQPEAVDSITVNQVLIQLLTNAALFLPFGIIMRWRRYSLESIGITRRNLAVSVFAGLLASLVVTAMTGHLSVSFWASSNTLLLLIAQLGVGFSEEAIFRGFVLSRLSARFSPLASNLIAAAIFALVHIPIRLMGGVTAAELIISLAILFVWGLSFNVLMRRTGNITGLAILHAVLNVVGG